VITVMAARVPQEIALQWVAGLVVCRNFTISGMLPIVSSDPVISYGTTSQARTRVRRAPRIRHVVKT